MINKVILIGNIGQDPEVRHLESGSTVATFSVATNENYKDKSGEWQTITEWHNIVAWRALAEMVERSYKKGMQVYVEGKLTTRKWQDKDGNDRRTTEVVAYSLRMLGGRDERNSASTSSVEAPSSFPTTAKPSAENTDNFNDNKEEDDLPF
jgi:single-strand DNA-binding protein